MTTNNLVIVYHSKILPDAPPDELDVLDEADFFEKNLLALGYRVIKKPFPSDSEELVQEITQNNPLFVVNLVETMLGDGRLIGIAPLLFEHTKTLYTGNNSQATYLTTNKLLAKTMMQQFGIPTPAFVALTDFKEKKYPENAKYILKAVWEHASFGMDEHTFKTLDSVEEVRQTLLAKGNKSHDFFAEEYIDGREFNISILGGENGAEVMPLAEIKFVDYPDDKLKIVGYRSKWDEESFEYQHTVRTFNDPTKELELQQKLKTICLNCWKAFNLKGYVRVDFRIDQQGNPWVLEINTNPCISPDAGFMAATKQAGIEETEVFKRIIYDTLAF